MINHLRIILIFAMLLISTESSRGQEVALKDAFAGDFVVGAALSERQIMGRAPEALSVVEKHFNSISPENSLKWEKVHPRPDEYNFGPADDYVEFGEQHGMFIVGHTLVWHSQTPRWVFQGENGQPLDREALLARMRDHINTVVGRYKGRIKGWDVVNEAIDIERGDDTRGKWRETNWRRIIGPDYIEKAFEYAHEADPDAELYYNDFDEWKSGKREYFAEIVKGLKAKGIRIDGIGLQGHWGFEYPTVTEIDLMLRDLGQHGVKLMITELDINVLPLPGQDFGADINVRFEERPEFNPYPDGLPKDVERRLTRRYAEIFRLFHKYRDNIDRVTFWGVGDGQSWLNNWPMRGRTNYPLLFDREHQPKPAFEAVIKIGGNAT
jgi:endo-1,4-beta-xylanase